MTNACECCHEEWKGTAAGSCSVCRCWIYCSCRKRFCKLHQETLYVEHKETCEGIASPN